MCQSTATFQGYLMCTSHFLNAICCYPESGSVASELLVLISQSVTHILLQLTEINKRIAENKGANFAGDSNEMCVILNNINSWLEMNSTVLSKAKEKISQIMEHYIYSQEISSILGNCVQFICFSPKQRAGTLISSTGEEEFDKLLNLVKKNALSLFNDILSYVNSTSHSSKLPHTPLFSFCGVIAPIALFTLN